MPCRASTIPLVAQPRCYNLGNLVAEVCHLALQNGGGAARVHGK